MEENKMKSIVESLLLTGGDTLKVSQLAKIVESEKNEIEKILADLSAEYAQAQRGFFILRKGEQVQLVSNPENSIYVEKLVKSELSDSLSPAALEVLAIIAYRGPISKAEIEAIRGVNCAYTLRNLLLRGLIEKSENQRDARGFVYVIAMDFLKKMGISEVEKLPEYAILSKDEKISELIQPSE